MAKDLADGNNIIHFYAKPAVPSAEEIAKALGDGAVVVDCVNADAEHEDGHYGLLGNYTPDTAVINTGGTYTFGITVEPSDYAEQYSPSSACRTISRVTSLHRESSWSGVTADGRCSLIPLQLPWNAMRAVVY